MTAPLVRLDGRWWHRDELISGAIVKFSTRAQARQYQCQAPVVVAHQDLRERCTRTVEVAMPTGTVKWFNDDKGYGFVTPDEVGKDLFVHHSDIAGEGFKSLAEGAKVSYEAQASDKGPQAVNVQPI